MSRLMSVALTLDQVRSRTKTVTRRDGWRTLRPGDEVTLCPKVRGRKQDEPLERIVTVTVVSVRRERLGAITQADVVAEGFPQMSPEDFIRFFCGTHQDITPDSMITRIEWRYPPADTEQNRKEPKPA